MTILGDVWLLKEDILRKVCDNVNNWFHVCEILTEVFIAISTQFL